MICRNCSVKYDFKQMKYLNNDISNNFIAACNRCHRYKPLLRTMRKDKGKDEIVYCQCNICCMKKHVKDYNKKNNK